MRNVLLIIVDCLRYDYVTEEKMPWLYKWGQEHTWFANHWATSHCTDPCITHMLSGYHPDELRLYSMMYNDANYSIPDEVEMLSQTAKRHGFTTCTISNLGRWYRWGVDHYIDCRNWPGQKIFNEAIAQVANLPEPWFMIVHTDDMHTNYTGGSYQNAAVAVNLYIRSLVEAVDEDNTWILITSDHGEGLGEKGIKQHGFGLWDFLTHVPLLTNFYKGVEWDKLTDHGSTFGFLNWFALGGDDFTPPVVELPMVLQAGATPRYFHRGVVWPDGRQFIRETSKNEEVALYFEGEFTDEEKWKIEGQLIDHCTDLGIRYGNLDMDAEVIERLKGLGYFD
jgi:hypothetical protein